METRDTVPAEAKTVFSLESGSRTYYIDYDPIRRLNRVSLDEKFILSFVNFGDAVEYIISKVGTISFKTRN